MEQDGNSGDGNAEKMDIDGPQTEEERNKEVHTIKAILDKLPQEDVKEWGEAVDLIFGVTAIQGRRPYMEDRHVTIYDLQKVDLDAKEGETWTCPSCVYMNWDGSQNCEMCKTERRERSDSASMNPELSTQPSKDAEEKKETSHPKEDQASKLEKFSKLPRQSIFTVYDGHGGQLTSTFAAANLHKQLLLSPYYPHSPRKALTEAFLVTDKLYNEKYKLNGAQDGSTSCVVVLIGNRIFGANAGDSRAVLCSEGKAVPLSFDHKPDKDSEKERIEKAGGTVKKGSFFNIPMGPFRIFLADGIHGGLAVARALGDTFYKSDSNRGKDEQLVIAVPEIVERTIDPSKDEFIVIASDGFWDVFSNEDAIEFTKRLKDEKKMNPNEASSVLTAEAFARDSLDNITVVVVYIRGAKDSESESGDGAEEEDTEEMDRKAEDKSSPEKETTSTATTNQENTSNEQVTNRL